MQIAERLAYNRLHQKQLNPKLFDDDDRLIPEVRDLLLKIAELFLEYTQVPDLKVYDIRLVGSNASYNYNEYSDVDIHIVTDLSKIADPESIARLLFDSVKKNFKDSYDITIKGHDAELYVEDINASPVSKGIYSITKDDWVRFPEESKDPTSMEYAEAENIEEDWIERLESAEDEDEIEKIIDEIYLARKDGLAKSGENDPHNLAFKSLRNKGILERSKDDAHEKISKKLSLESKRIKGI